VRLPSALHGVNAAWRICSFDSRRSVYYLDVTSFDDYLASVPQDQRAELARIREIVRSSVPDVEESVSYGMPAFKYRGRPLLGFKVARNHLSVFPFSPAAIDAARDALAGFDISKGTVRFAADKPLPDSAIEQLVRHRLGEIENG
jgi:uncharacterized protein YdhG (YjbR/CyaY superfamily)